MNKFWKILEMLAACAIFVIAIVFVTYSYKLASGYLEPEWAYRGVTFSSHNAMMLFLFGLSGGGIIYLSNRFIGNTIAKIFCGVVGSLLAAYLMASNQYLYGMVPFLIVLIIMGIVLNDRKIKRESSE